jgi:uncharacterized membrane protein
VFELPSVSVGDCMKIFVRTLIKFAMILGFYLIYGIILMGTTSLNPNSTTFLVIDLTAAVVSTVLLTMADIYLEDE